MILFLKIRGALEESETRLQLKICAKPRICTKHCCKMQNVFMRIHDFIYAQNTRTVVTAPKRWTWHCWSSMLSRVHKNSEFWRRWRNWGAIGNIWHAWLILFRHPRWKWSWWLIDSYICFYWLTINFLLTYCYTGCRQARKTYLKSKFLPANYPAGAGYLKNNFILNPNWPLWTINRVRSMVQKIRYLQQMVYVAM